MFVSSAAFREANATADADITVVVEDAGADVTVAVADVAADAVAAAAVAIMAAAVVTAREKAWRRGFTHRWPSGIPLRVSK